MASKRTGTSVPLKGAISSPIPQASQQAKPKSPPPSPPPAITLKDLKDAMAQVFEKNVELVNEMVKKNAELVNQRHDELRLDIVDALQGLTGHVERIDGIVEEMVEKVERVEERLDKLENDADLTQNECLMTQYREMEFALRIRGVKENAKEDLKQEIAADIAQALECEVGEIEKEIEKIYRVNSWVARQRKLPRDIVIYFSRRTRRNEIIQAFYKEKFQIAAQDVIILKEIPPKILRKRKEFAFLTEELKKQQIQFRWEIPIGVVVNIAGTRYRLNTVQKAKEFYASVLKAGSPLASRVDSKEDLMVQQAIEEDMFMRAQYLLEKKDNLESQRITRAAHRRKEKEQQKEEQAAALQTAASEPVGGARPKRNVSVDMQKAFGRFLAKKDG